MRNAGLADQENEIIGLPDATSRLSHRACGETLPEKKENNH